MTTPPVDPLDKTNLTTSNFHTGTGVLNTIFNQLLNVTTSLQNVATAQAARLNLYTTIQQGYTQKLTQVHTFATDNGDYIGDPNNSGATTERQNLNQKNTAFTTNLTNQQSIYSDDAKALQSNVNQSNDAVSQQSNLGTSILQELGTLMTSIFT